VWDAATGEAIIHISHLDHVKWADFSPDGKKIVTASTDNTSCVWDFRANRPAIPPIQHGRIIETALFSHEGDRLITASLDRTARIWDVRTGDALTPPLGHDYSLVSACFARGDELALTGCWNGAVRAWDPQTGQPTTESLDGGGWTPRLVALDPAGRAMATGGKDAIVRLWQIPAIRIPVPEWFLTFAETVAGIRLDARGHVECVAQLEFEAALRDLQSKDKNEFYVRLARWLLADPKDRETTPF
jgi:WD40 repeat protein